MKRGFTLIELAVVLVILALLTHLAVREFGTVLQGKMHKLADQQLESIRSAVWQTQASDEPSGFLVDMGRLPLAQTETNTWGRTVFTLSELWKRPAGVPAFALRPAMASNLVSGVDAALADSSVLIPCGWRGPYLHLPFGRDRLLDPWGNPMETPDDAGYARLQSTNQMAVAAGAPVDAVAHWGSDARPDSSVTPPDDTARDSICPLVPGSLSNTLFTTVVFPEATTGELRWYMPCGGAITGAVATATSSSTFVCSGVAPGVCTLVVRIGSVNRLVERVVVPPGGRAVQLVVH